MKICIFICVLLIINIASAAQVDHFCNKEQCSFRLVSLNKEKNITWKVDGQSYTGEEINIPQKTKNEEFINYIVTFENVGGKFIYTGEVKNTSLIHVPTGRSAIIYSGKLGTYVGIPYQRNVKLKNDSNYGLVSDHIGLIPYGVQNITLYIEKNDITYADKLTTSENLSPHFLKIITNGTVSSEYSTNIIGKVISNINSKYLENITLKINDIETQLNDVNEFTFVSLQKENSVYVQATVIGGKTYEDKVKIINPNMNETICEFSLDQEQILLATCSSDIGIITKMEFYEDDFRIGKFGNVLIEKSRTYNLIFKLTLDQSEELRYQINIGSNGKIDAKKQV